MSEEESISFDLSKNNKRIRRISAENIKDTDWSGAKFNGFDVWDGKEWKFIPSESLDVPENKD